MAGYTGSYDGFTVLNLNGGLGISGTGIVQLGSGRLYSNGATPSSMSGGFS